MIGRRLFLKLFGGLLSLAVVQKVAVIEAVAKTVTNQLKLPSWCPYGFIPEVGQQISAEQYPELFEKDGKYTPPYHGRKAVKLPYSVKWLETLDPVKRAGFIDNLTRLPPTQKLDDCVRVGLIAATKQIAPNGRVLKPGWSADIMVERDDFLKAYPGLTPKGPLSNPAWVAYDGYSETGLGSRT